MATPKQDTARLNAAKRKLFLTHLCETANVSASARAADISSSAVYSERRRLPEFRVAWSDALAEGYTRLEADLLAQALQAASSQISEGTLKARAQKHRLGISLLNAHRVSVKSAPVPLVARGKKELSVMKAELTLKLTQMRERAGISLNGLISDQTTQTGQSDGGA